MSNHTEGPWEVHLHAHDSVNGSAIVSPSGLRVVSMPRIADRPYPQKEADARLIAAAPDLLAACKTLLEYHMWAVSGDWRDEPVEPTTIARAAIAKAEGA